MAPSKDELAQALEAMTSGKADAHHEAQREPIAEPPAAARAEHVSHTIRPLPGRPGVPADDTYTRPVTKRGTFLKQTAIPPLLTLGTLMPLAGVASLMMGEDSPLGEQPVVSVLLILLGILILGAAVLNMLQVKHLLSAASKR